MSIFKNAYIKYFLFKYGKNSQIEIFWPELIKKKVLLMLLMLIYATHMNFKHKIRVICLYNLYNKFKGHVVWFIFWWNIFIWEISPLLLQKCMNNEWKCIKIKIVKVLSLKPCSTKYIYIYTYILILVWFFSFTHVTCKNYWLLYFSLTNPASSSCL